MRHEPIIEAYRICRCPKGFVVEARVRVLHENTITTGFWPFKKTTVERREVYQWHAIDQNGALGSWLFKCSIATYKDQKDAENLCEYLSAKEHVVKEYEVLESRSDIPK